MLLKTIVVFAASALLASALLTQVAAADQLKFTNVDYTGMDLRGRSFAGAKISNVEFNEANLENVDFTGAKLKNVKFIGANLRGVCFLNSSMSNSEFAKADLSDAVLVGVDARNTDFGDAVTDGVVREGRAKCKVVSPRPNPAARGNGKEITNTNHNGQDLRGHNFNGVKFSNVQFRGTNLAGVNFANAILRNVHFEDANLRGACFENAEMTNVEFAGADLSDAVLLGARESNTNYKGATMPKASQQLCASVKTVAVTTRPEVTSADTIEKALVKGEKVDLTINFEFDSDQIRGRGHKQVLEIANALRSAGLVGVRIGVEGHTDSDGSNDYNNDLSYRRAITVVHVLGEKYGIEQRRFKVQGYGEDRPVASNETDQGRALNRRVTLANLGRM